MPAGRERVAGVGTHVHARWFGAREVPGCGFATEYGVEGISPDSPSYPSGQALGMKSVPLSLGRPFTVSRGVEVTAFGTESGLGRVTSKPDPPAGCAEARRVPAQGPDRLPTVPRSRDVPPSSVSAPVTRTIALSPGAVFFGFSH